MTLPAPIVLITRPERQAAEFAAMLPVGVDVVISPLMAVRSVAATIDPARYSALVITSTNALRALDTHPGLRELPAFAVGDRSAAAAQELGMKAKSAGGNADDLIKLLEVERPPGRLLFLRGRHSTGDIRKRLERLGLETDEATVYDQVSRPLTDEAREVLAGQRPVLLPLFSARSAKLAGDRIGAQTVRASLSLVAISPATLAAWDGPPTKASVIAAKPTARAVAEALLRLIG